MPCLYVIATVVIQKQYFIYISSLGCGHRPALEYFIYEFFYGLIKLYLKQVYIKQLNSYNSLKVIKVNLYNSNFFFPVISGLLLTASFPLAGLDWIIWFALVPMMFCINESSCKNSFYAGFLTGFIHYITLIYWLISTMITYGNIPFLLSVSALVFLSAYLSVYIAVFSAILRCLRPSPLISIILFPALWVLLEYIRSFLFTGFPWGLTGYSQFNSLKIIQISDIFGVYGVSFLIALSNITVLLVILYVKGDSWQGRKIKGNHLILSIIIFILTFCSSWQYGKDRIKTIDRLVSTSPVINTAIIQGNIDQAVKWDKAYQRSSIEKYIKLSKSLKKEKPDLIVWPETAAPFYLSYNKDLTNLLIKGISTVETDFIIGAPSFTLANDKIKYFNSAFLINKNSEICGKYDKSHLVPFGEYIPLGRWVPFLDKIVTGVGNFQTGKKGAIINWGEYKLGVLICYEIIFPSLANKMLKKDADLIINITNDAWYGRSSAPFQHFSMAVFRAVENRRSLIRAANTGISGFIDPAGRIIAKTDIFKEAALTCPVPILHNKSFYSRHGDLLIIACFGAVLIISTYCVYRKKQIKGIGGKNVY